MQVRTKVRLRLLERLNESRVRNHRIKAALKLREDQYRDLKSRFPEVEEAEGLKKVEMLEEKQPEAVAPAELIQRVKDLEAQVSAKDEAYKKLSSEVEAFHTAHLRDASLLEEALKDKDQQVSRCKQFEEVCSQLRLEASQ